MGGYSIPTNIENGSQRDIERIFLLFNPMRRPTFSILLLDKYLQTIT
jgi:hypothetical protein